MSNYYGNYSQYLGAQRCCNLKVQGPIGPPGPQGPAGIGQRGDTGISGQSYTGPTGRGCRGYTGPPGNPSGLTGYTGYTGHVGDIGPMGYTGYTGYTGHIGDIGPMGYTGYTGYTGPAGFEYWDPSGANGISYQNDVYIGGKLYVDGGIDPTYLALTPQASNPMPSGMYGIWVDGVNGNALRSNLIYMDDGNPNITLQPGNNAAQILLSDGVSSENNLVYNNITLNNLPNSITVDSTVPSITITDGTNTNTITAIASGGSQNLSQVLTVGNSAGSTNINMNNNDILQVNNINLTTINSSAYPPTVSTPNLSSVLTAGNTANNTITLTDGTNTSSIGLGTISVTTNSLVTPALNINTTSTGINFVDLYNQRTAIGGVNNSIRFNATDSSGNKTPYANINSSSVSFIAGNTQGSLNIDVLTSSGLTTFLSANGSVNQIILYKQLNLNGNSITYAPNITCQDNNANIYTYAPTLQVDASSNIPVPIPFTTSPTSYNNILVSQTVPLIDRLQQYGNTIGGETIYCNCWTGSYQYVGTNAGNIYYWNTGTNTWDLIATMNGQINAMFYQSNQLYIGGTFTDCSYPSILTGFNYCGAFSGSPNSSTSPYQLYWNNYRSYGFNGNVNAITGDGTYIYWGGQFTYDSNININCNRFAISDPTISGNLYPLNLTSGDGFDGDVWNLSYTNGIICATGSFYNIILAGSYTNSQFCIGFSISGYNGSSPQVFAGNAGALTVPITNTSLIATDGNNFYIGTSTSYNSVNYLFGIPYYSFSSQFQVGNNNFDNPITSLYYYSGVYAITSSNSYYFNGELQTTPIPFSAYTFYNYGLGSYNQSLYSQGSGTFWNFSGVNDNDFPLQGGRAIFYNGAGYTGGVKFYNGGVGYTCCLYWNGTYYLVTGGIGFTVY